MLLDRNRRVSRATIDEPSGFGPFDDREIRSRTASGLNDYLRAESWRPIELAALARVGVWHHPVCGYQ